MTKPDDSITDRWYYFGRQALTKRELFTLVALHATILKGEPEDTKHNAIVAVRQADAAIKALNVE